MAGTGTQRRRYTAKFKLRVARDAIRNEEAHHGVHPNQVRDWRSQYDEGGRGAFQNKAKREADQATTIKDLYPKMDELTMGRDFFVLC